MTDRPLRLGIDAKWLNSGPISGGVVLRGIVRGLTELAPRHEITLFRPKHAIGKSPQHPFREVATPNRLPNLLSNVFVVPRLADEMGLDAVLYQSYAPTRARHQRVCLVHDVIDLDHPEYFTAVERLYLRSRRYLIPRSDHLVTISNSERLRLARLGLLPTDAACDVVQWGVDERFRPLPEHQPAVVVDVRRRLQLPDRFLLYVGRLNERKNLPGLINSALASSNVTARTPLIIAGTPDGKWTAPLGTQAAEREGRIRFLGRIAEDDLPALIALATAFAYVSLDEGFGLPPLEAMASGVPVVAANSGSLPEVCGEAALLVDGTDHDQVRRAVDRVLTDENARREMIHKGLSRASQFTWLQTADTLIRILETTLTGARQS